MVKYVIRSLLILSAYLLLCALGYLGYVTLQTNLIGWYLLLTAIGYGLGGPYLLWQNLKTAPTKRQESHDRSFWVIIPGFLFIYYAPPLEYLFIRAIIPRTLSIQVIGLVLVILNLVLFILARRAIKGMYSGRLRVTANHVLVQSGPYKVIRHPAYAAYILMSLGIALGYSSLIGLFATTALLIPALIYRMDVEEQILTAEFGEQYTAYSKTTKRLLPGVW